MKKNVLVLFLFSIFLYAKAQETVTISGRVTDFEGNPVDSSAVLLRYPDSTDAYATHTDKNGFYTLNNIKKGKYQSLFAMRWKEYPRSNAVEEKDMRLEFWGWNIIADRDLIINPRYHRLEVYGTTAFRSYGGYPGFFIYFRPMSTTKYISASKDIYLDKSKAEQNVNISVKPEDLELKIYADEELLKINTIDTFEEFMGEGNQTATAYIVQTERPLVKTDKPYIIFRVEAINKEFNEKGESIYFYEKPNFVENNK